MGENALDALLRAVRYYALNAPDDPADEAMLHEWAHIAAFHEMGWCPDFTYNLRVSVLLELCDRRYDAYGPVCRREVRR